MTIHSKDAYGSCEDAEPLIGGLQPRVELRPPLDVPVSGGHFS